MNVAIVVAGGKGVRFGGDRPKQFLELRGTPIIIHTLRQFERCREIEKLIVVLPAEETAGFVSLAAEFDLKKISRVVAGGETRARSVRNGLESIDDAEVVAVHDCKAARDAGRNRPGGARGANERRRDFGVAD